MVRIGVSRANRDLPAAELLREPVTTLIGITEDVAAALQNMRVSNVFDLATSNAFGDATGLLLIADPNTVEAALAMLPADALDVGAAGSIADIPSLAASSLVGIDDVTAAALAGVGVVTIDDIAHWPPYLSARRILAEALGGERVFDVEERDAERLRPRIGEYPTERVYYESLVMLDPGDNTGLQPLEEIGQVPLDRLFQPPDSAQRIAVGAILTFSQSWFVQGVTLGSLLHSVALAPGEATRVAVVDWNRRSKGSAEASVSATDVLDASSGRSRALSEVTAAVATESQSGFSASTSRSSLDSKSETSAAVDNSFLGGVFGGDTGSSGISEVESTLTSSASSIGWSSGSRDITAELTQNVAESTEQNATSVRNRRATTVQEVSDSESEHISTRIVANYNHMHALTVQYWEVVQTYRVQVSLERYTRALFVPLESLDFGNDAVVDRFRFLLARVALTRRARELLLERPTVTELRPSVSPLIVDPGFFNFGPVAAVIDFDDSRPLLAAPSTETGGPSEPQPAAASSSSIQPGAGDVAARNLFSTVRFRRGTVLRSAPLAATNGSSIANVAAAAASSTLGINQAVQPGETRGVWNLPAINKAAEFFNRPILSASGTALEAPVGAMLEAIDLEGFGTESIEIVTTDDTFTPPTNGSSLVRLDTAIPLISIQRVSVRRGRTRMAGTVNLRLRQHGALVIYPFPMSVSAGDGYATVVAATGAGVPQFSDELKTHLQSNRLHYSRTVYESLDPSQVSALLAGFSFEGQPLLAGVEPRPFAIAGNYLVLRAPADEDEDEVGNGGRSRTSWGRLVDQFHLGEMGHNPPRLISLPSGGVFAEAVLGRSNSAEKLDITRFWDWQESPIPLTPPEIAPVVSGQHSGSPAPGTDRLDAPIIAQSTPLVVPDPGAAGALLSAISASNIFRDMSGLAGTQSLAQVAGQGAVTAGGDAVQAALGAQQIEAQRSVAVQQLGSDMFKSLLGAAMAGAGAAVGGPAGLALGQAGGQLLGGGQRGTGSSATGAKINQGKDMDARGVSGPSSGEGSSGGASSGDGPGGSSPGSTGGSGNSGGGSASRGGGSGLGAQPSGNERAAFQSALPVQDSDVGRTLADIGRGPTEESKFVLGSTGQKAAASVERRLLKARAAVPTGPGFNVVKMDDDSQLLTGRVVIANFDVNSAVLKPEALPAIADVAAVLDSPTALAYIEGRASQTGPEDYNLLLSDQRAEAGFEGLLRYGVDPEKIIDVIGLGSTEPLIDRRGFEEPLNRSLTIAYQVPLERPVKTNPPVARPTGTTDWWIRVALSGSAGHAGIGGAGAIVQLTRRDSLKPRQGYFAGGGIGVGLQSPGIDPGWGEYEHFETNVSIDFEDFDGIPALLEMAGAGVSLFGYSWAEISFPTLGAHSISVGGWNMGAIGADASVNGGYFWLDDAP